MIKMKNIGLVLLFLLVVISFVNADDVCCKFVHPYLGVEYFQYDNSYNTDADCEDDGGVALSDLGLCNNLQCVIFQNRFDDEGFKCRYANPNYESYLKQTTYVDTNYFVFDRVVVDNSGECEIAPDNCQPTVFEQLDCITNTCEISTGVYLDPPATCEFGFINLQNCTRRMELCGDEDTNNDLVVDELDICPAGKFCDTELHICREETPINCNDDCSCITTSNICDTDFTANPATGGKECLDWEYEGLCPDHESDIIETEASGKEICTLYPDWYESCSIELGTCYGITPRTCMLDNDCGIYDRCYCENEIEYPTPNNEYIDINGCFDFIDNDCDGDYNSDDIDCKELCDVDGDGFWNISKPGCATTLSWNDDCNDFDPHLHPANVTGALGGGALQNTCSCKDGRRNGDEVGVDCSGSCASMGKNDGSWPHVERQSCCYNGIYDPYFGESSTDCGSVCPNGCSPGGDSSCDDDSDCLGYGFGIVCHENKCMYDCYGTYSFNPDCNGGIWCSGVYNPGETTCPSSDCTDDPEIESITTFEKEKKFDIEYDGTCPEVLEVHLYRNISGRQTMTEIYTYKDNSFTDDDNTFSDEFEYFDSTYCYMISITNSSGVFESDALCVESGPPECYIPGIETYCNGNEIWRCNTNNLGDPDSDCSSFEVISGETRDGICSGPNSLGRAECIVLSDCATCNGPLQMFATLGFKTEIWDDINDQDEEVLCDDSKVQTCYVDFSDPISMANVDKYYGCDPLMTCYDYRSQNTCETNFENDKCKITGECEWITFDEETKIYGYDPENTDNFGSVGLGICRPVNETKQDCGKCHDNPYLLCDNLDVCSKYGDCFYSLKDKECVDFSEIGCYDYYRNNKFCLGDPDHPILEMQKNNISFVLNNYTNVPTQYSNDLINLSKCDWFDAGSGEQCFKDANDNNKSDCKEDSEYTGDALRTCVKDNDPPTTFLNLAPRMGKSYELVREVVDLYYPNSDTYYCVANETEGSCYPNIDLENNDNLHFGYEDEGINTIYWYSEDGAHNLEEVQSYPFIVDVHINNGSYDYIYMSCKYNISSKDCYEDINTIFGDEWRSHVNLTVVIEDPSNISCGFQFWDNYTEPYNVIYPNLNDPKFISFDMREKIEHTFTINHLLDGIYYLYAECEDGVGNVGNNSDNENGLIFKRNGIIDWEIIVDGDKSITNPLPRGTLNYNNPLIINITTENEATCRYSNQTLPYVNSQLEMYYLDVPIAGLDYDMFNMDQYFNGTHYFHYDTLDLSAFENDFFKLSVVCEFNDSLGETFYRGNNDVDNVRFSIDVTHPNTYIVDNDGNDYEFEDFYNHIPNDMFLDCVDPEIEGEGSNFGCSHVMYCLERNNDPTCIPGNNPNTYIPGGLINIDELVSIDSNTEYVTIRFRSNDSGGFYEPEQTEIINLDTTLPEVRIAFNHDKFLNGKSILKEGKYSFNITSNEELNYTGRVHFKIIISSEFGTIETIDSTEISVTYPELTSGGYLYKVQDFVIKDTYTNAVEGRITLIATDKAGNKIDYVEGRDFYIDINEPIEPDFDPYFNDRIDLYRGSGNVYYTKENPIYLTGRSYETDILVYTVNVSNSTRTLFENQGYPNLLVDAGKNVYSVTDNPPLRDSFAVIKVGDYTISSLYTKDDDLDQFKYIKFLNHDQQFPYKKYYEIESYIEASDISPDPDYFTLTEIIEGPIPPDTLALVFEKPYNETYFGNSTYLTETHNYIYLIAVDAAGNPSGNNLTFDTSNENSIFVYHVVKDQIAPNLGMVYPEADNTVNVNNYSTDKPYFFLIENDQGSGLNYSSITMFFNGTEKNFTYYAGDGNITCVRPDGNIHKHKCSYNITNDSYLVNGDYTVNISFMDNVKNYNHVDWEFTVYNMSPDKPVITFVEAEHADDFRILGETNLYFTNYTNVLKISFNESEFDNGIGMNFNLTDIEILDNETVIDIDSCERYNISTFDCTFNHNLIDGSYTLKVRGMKNVTDINDWSADVWFTYPVIIDTVVPEFDVSANPPRATKGVSVGIEADNIIEDYFDFLMGEVKIFNLTEYKVANLDMDNDIDVLTTAWDTGTSNDGNYTVNVSVRDPAGNIGVRNLIINVDGIGPEFNVTDVIPYTDDAIIFYEDGIWKTNASSYNITGFYNYSDDGVDDVDEIYIYKKNEKDLGHVLGDIDHSTRDFMFDNFGYFLSTNNYSIEASDVAGNVRTKDLIIIRDQDPPTITVDPNDPFAIAGTFTPEFEISLDEPGVIFNFYLWGETGEARDLRVNMTNLTPLTLNDTFTIKVDPIGINLENVIDLENYTLKVNARDRFNNEHILSQDINIYNFNLHDDFESPLIDIDIFSGTDIITRPLNDDLYWVYLNVINEQFMLEDIELYFTYEGSYRREIELMLTGDKGSDEYEYYGRLELPDYYINNIQADAWFNVTGTDISGNKNTVNVGQYFRIDTKNPGIPDLDPGLDVFGLFYYNNGYYYTNQNENLNITGKLDPFNLGDNGRVKVDYHIVNISLFNDVLNNRIDFMENPDLIYGPELVNLIDQGTLRENYSSNIILVRNLIINESIYPDNYIEVDYERMDPYRKYYLIDSVDDKIIYLIDDLEQSVNDGNSYYLYDNSHPEDYFGKAVLFNYPINYLYFVAIDTALNPSADNFVNDYITGYYNMHKIYKIAVDEDEPEPGARWPSDGLTINKNNLSVHKPWIVLTENDIQDIRGSGLNCSSVNINLIENNSDIDCNYIEHSSYSMIYNITFDPGYLVNGLYNLEINVTDNVNNLNVITSSFVVDNSTPSTPTIAFENLPHANEYYSTTGKYFINQTTGLIINFSSDEIIDLIDVVVMNDSDVGLYDGCTNSTLYTYNCPVSNEIIDSEYNISIKARRWLEDENAWGNQGEYPFKFILDTIQPNFTLSSDDFVGPNDIVDIIAEMINNEINKVAYITIESGSPETMAPDTVGFVKQWDTTGKITGEYDVVVSVFDYAGNYMTKEKIIYVDADAPIIYNIEIDEDPDEYYELQDSLHWITGDEDVTIKGLIDSNDIETIRISGSTGYYQDATIVDNEFTIEDYYIKNKDVDFTIEAIDEFGNVNETLIKLELDDESPVITLISPDEGKLPGYQWSFTFKIECDEECYMEEIILMDITDDVEIGLTQSVADANYFEFTSDPMNDLHQYELRVNTIDKYGNKNSVGVPNIIYSFFMNYYLDEESPEFDIVIKQGDEVIDRPLKKGTYFVGLHHDETRGLLYTPNLTYNYSVSYWDYVPVDLRSSVVFDYKGYMTIDHDFEKDAEFNIVAEDLSGNDNVTINSGKYFSIDTIPPDQPKFDPILSYWNFVNIDNEGRYLTNRTNFIVSVNSSEPNINIYYYLKNSQEVSEIEIPGNEYKMYEDEIEKYTQISPVLEYVGEVQEIRENNKLFTSDNLASVINLINGKYLEFEDHYKSSYGNYKHYYQILDIISVEGGYLISLDGIVEGPAIEGNEFYVYNLEIPENRSETEITFNEGENYVYTIAEDYALNPSINFIFDLKDEWIIVVYDSSVPELLNTYPENDETLNQNNFEGYIRVAELKEGSGIDEDSIYLELDGESISYNVDLIELEGFEQYNVYDIEFDVNKDNGQYLLEYEVKDISGNLLIGDINFGIDNTIPNKPFIDMGVDKYPYNGENYSFINNQGSFILEFDSGDNIVLEHIEIENMPSIAISCDQINLYTFNCEFDGDLIEAEYKINVQARKYITATELGGLGSWNYYFVYDVTPPEFTVDYTNSVKGGVEVLINVEVLNEIRSNGFININEEVNTMDILTSSGEFKYQWSTIGLDSGDYNFEVEFIDLAGNSNDESGMINVDATPPSIVIDNVYSSVTSTCILKIIGFNSWKTSCRNIKIDGHYLDNDVATIELYNTNNLNYPVSGLIIDPANKEFEISLNIYDDSSYLLIPVDNAGNRDNVYQLSFEMDDHIEQPIITPTGKIAGDLQPEFNVECSEECELVNYYITDLTSSPRKTYNLTETNPGLKINHIIQPDEILIDIHNYDLTVYVKDEFNNIINKNILFDLNYFDDQEDPNITFDIRYMDMTPVEIPLKSGNYIVILTHDESGGLSAKPTISYSYPGGSGLIANEDVFLIDHPLIYGGYMEITGSNYEGQGDFNVQASDMSGNNNPNIVAGEKFLIDTKKPLSPVFDPGLENLMDYDGSNYISNREIFFLSGNTSEAGLKIYYYLKDQEEFNEISYYNQKMFDDPYSIYVENVPTNLINGTVNQVRDNNIIYIIGSLSEEELSKFTNNYISFENHVRIDKQYYRIVNIVQEGIGYEIMLEEEIEDLDDVDSGDDFYVYDGPVPGTYFDSNVEFDEGLNYLYLIAEDAALNPSITSFGELQSDLYTIIVDTGEPILVEVSPPMNQMLNVNDFDSYIRVAEEKLSSSLDLNSIDIFNDGVLINHVTPYLIEVDGYEAYNVYQIDYNLGYVNDGDHTLEFFVSDIIGNNISETWHIYVDTTIPDRPAFNMQNLYPGNPYAYNGNNVFFINSQRQFTLEFDDEIESLNVESDIEIACSGSNNNYLCNFQGDLQEGMNEIRVNATKYIDDTNVGGVGQWTYYVVLDTINPNFTLDYDDSVRASVDVDIEAMIYDEIMVNGLIQINSEVIGMDVVKHPDEFVHLFETGLLETGDYEFNIEFTDWAGNSNIESGIINVDATPPSLNIENVIGSNMLDERKCVVSSTGGNSWITSCNDLIISGSYTDDDLDAIEFYHTGSLNTEIGNVIVHKNNQTFTIDFDLILDGGYIMIPVDDSGNRDDENYGLYFEVDTSIESPFINPGVNSVIEDAKPIFNLMFNEVVDVISANISKSGSILSYEMGVSTNNNVNFEMTPSEWLRNANYILDLVVIDNLNNSETFSFGYEVDAAVINIKVYRPTFGVTDVSPVDLTIKTTAPGNCLWSRIRGEDSVPVNQFDNTDGIFHNLTGFSIINGDQIIVQCQHQITGFINTEEFIFYIDSLDPSIDSAEVFPTSVEEISKVGDLRPGKTTFNITTNTLTICRYHENETHFENMTAFDDLEGGSFINESNLLRQDFTKEHTYELYVPEDEKTYSYYVACKSLTDKYSETKILTFSVDLGRVMRINVIDPETEINHTDVVLRLTSSQDADCDYLKEELSAQAPTVLASSNGYEHEESLGTYPGEGEYDLTVTCTSDKDRISVQHSFIIDTNPPVVSDVQLFGLNPQSGDLVLNELESTKYFYANWTGNDTGSGIDYYKYKFIDNDDNVIKNWKKIWDDELNRFTFSGLKNEVDYKIVIKAYDEIGLESEEIESNLITFKSQPNDPPRPDDHCRDGVENRDESDTDCGGDDCARCLIGDKCEFDIDCASEVCSTVTNTCVSPSCFDNIMNNDETDVDCGGACASNETINQSCGIGLGCSAKYDCDDELYCANNLCSYPTCDDGLWSQNETHEETDIDCGGICDACNRGNDCDLDSDCKDQYCSPGKKCEDPNKRDDDNDNMPDYWEIQYFGDISQDAGDDYDNDGLTNYQEYQYETNPTDSDSDGDGYNDGREVDADTDPNDSTDHPQGINLLLILAIIVLLILVVGAGVYLYLMQKNKPKVVPRREVPIARVPTRVQARPSQEYQRRMRAQMEARKQRRMSKSKERSKLFDAFGGSKVPKVEVPDIKIPGTVKKPFVKRITGYVPISKLKEVLGIKPVEKKVPKVEKTVEKVSKEKDVFDKLADINKPLRERKVIQAGRPKGMDELSQQFSKLKDLTAQISAPKKPVKLIVEKPTKVVEKPVKKVVEKPVKTPAKPVKKVIEKKDVFAELKKITKKEGGTKFKKVMQSGDVSKVKEDMFKDLGGHRDVKVVHKHKDIFDQLSEIGVSRKVKNNVLNGLKGSKKEIVANIKQLSKGKTKTETKNVFSIVLSSLLKMKKITKSDVSQIMFDLKGQKVLSDKDISDVLFDIENK
ncbi:hypothetical protein ACFL1H_00255 [Nanoarchaeota archaeon]